MLSFEKFLRDRQVEGAVGRTLMPCVVSVLHTVCTFASSASAGGLRWAPQGVFTPAPSSPSLLASPHPIFPACAQNSIELPFPGQDTVGATPQRVSRLRPSPQGALLLVTLSAFPEEWKIGA